MNKPRVMIAEDEGHSRVLLKALLSSMNCEVVCEATRGTDVLELYKKHRPHLLLLDINMPAKTGIEVLGEIMAGFPDALVIMMTSVADAESIEKCLQLGAVNYIRKDTPLNEIRIIIKETWQSLFQVKSGNEA